MENETELKINFILAAIKEKKKKTNEIQLYRDIQNDLKANFSRASLFWPIDGSQLSFYLPPSTIYLPSQTLTVFLSEIKSSNSRLGRPSLMSVVLSKADSRVLTQSNEGCVWVYAHNYVRVCVCDRACGLFGRVSLVNFPLCCLGYIHLNLESAARPYYFVVIHQACDI